MSPIFCTFALARRTFQLSMELCNLKAQSLGRTELATRYFPHILPQTAWQKLRGLLASDPDLAPLAQLEAEVVSSGRSQQNLPSTRGSHNCPFFVHFRLFEFP